MAEFLDKGVLAHLIERLDRRYKLKDLPPDAPPPAEGGEDIHGDDNSTGPGAERTLNYPGLQHLVARLDLRYNSRYIRTVNGSGPDGEGNVDVEGGGSAYTLPTAGADVKGGVKIGSGLTMTGEVLSADVQSSNDYTTAEKSKLAGIEAGANAYTHPGYTARESGLYKVTVDEQGHVSGASAVQKSDITALGIPGQDTTYSNASTTTAGLMSAADKSKLSEFDYARTYAKSVNNHTPDNNGNISLAMSDLEGNRDYFSYTVTPSEWTYDSANHVYKTDTVAADLSGLDYINLLDSIVVQTVTDETAGTCPANGYYYSATAISSHSLGITTGLVFETNMPAAPDVSLTFKGYLLHDEAGSNPYYYVTGRDSAYPVGSLYLSLVPTSPAIIFGGTWERIEGKFLLAATGDTPESGTNIQKTAAVGPGGQGGEAAHQLSENEMPSHRHAISRSQVAASGTARNIVQGNSGTDTYTGYVGGNQTHNNMPPFLAVYIWKRTA